MCGPNDKCRCLQPFFHIDNPAPLDFVVYHEQTHAHDKAPVCHVFGGQSLAVPTKRRRNVALQAAKLFEAAATWLKQAQELLIAAGAGQALTPAEAQERDALVRICKTNTIVFRLLGAGHKHPAQPQFDFTAHPHFPLFVLK